MGGPVKSRDGHLFMIFSKKRHDKSRYVMGSHGISRQLLTKGESHWCKQYYIQSPLSITNRLEPIKLE
jgi:hypothetical protein